MANPTIIEAASTTLVGEGPRQDTGSMPVSTPVIDPRPIDPEGNLLAGPRAIIAQGMKDQPSTPPLADYGFGETPPQTGVNTVQEE